RSTSCGWPRRSSASATTPKTWPSTSSTSSRGPISAIPTPRSSAPEVGATILVVEDEPQIQELLAINLQHAGHRVVRASSAEEAESAIRAELPDVVILDWMLPG